MAGGGLNCSIGEEVKLFLKDEDTQQFVQNAQKKIQSKFMDTQEKIVDADVGAKVDDLAETVTKQITWCILKSGEEQSVSSEDKSQGG